MNVGQPGDGGQAEPASEERTMTPGAAGPYRVVPMGTVISELRAMSDRAINFGVEREFSACLRQIQTRLASDRLGWDEIRFHSRALGLAVGHAGTSMLHVRFAVDETRRIVYLRDALPWTLFDFLRAS
jgi:hypothetical protein